MKPTTTYIHKTSIVDNNVTIGASCRIWHFCHISSGSKLGSECVLGQNVYIGPNVEIGSGVKLQNNVSVYQGIVIEDDVFCGPSMVFTNVINPRAFIERKEQFKKTIVRKGATLGANCTILCGIEIGEYALVGAGAAVTKSIPAFALVAGVPARQHGWVSKYGHNLNFQNNAATCPESSDVYELINGKCMLKPENKHEVF